MAHKAGKHYRGISLVELMDMFPDEGTAHEWFTVQRWGGETGRTALTAGLWKRLRASATILVPRLQEASVRTGSVLDARRYPSAWAIAVYLTVTSLKGVSSMNAPRPPSRRVCLVHGAPDTQGADARRTAVRGTSRS